MDPGKKAYRVRAVTQSGNAFVICVSYPLGAAMTTYSIDFYELVWSENLPPETIPTSRQASFKEELRANHKASLVCDTNSESEVDFIARNIRDVYGDNALVTLSSIDENLQTTAL